MPCLILAVASGLSLGHEGPMVHVGVCWANLLPASQYEGLQGLLDLRSRLFPQFRNEGMRPRACETARKSARQQLFSAAVAAGVGGRERFQASSNVLRSALPLVRPWVVCSLAWKRPRRGYKHYRYALRFVASIKNKLL